MRIRKSNFEKTIVRKLIKKNSKLCGRFLILTKRQKEVLFYIMQGLMNKQIAYKLHVGIKTIEAHRSMIFDKLEIRNIREFMFTLLFE